MRRKFLSIVGAIQIGTNAWMLLSLNLTGAWRPLTWSSLQIQRTRPTGTRSLLDSRSMVSAWCSSIQIERNQKSLVCKNMNSGSFVRVSSFAAPFPYPFTHTPQPSGTSSASAQLAPPPVPAPTRRSKGCAYAKRHPWWNTDSARQSSWWVAPCQNRSDLNKVLSVEKCCPMHQPPLPYRHEWWAQE